MKKKVVISSTVVTILSVFILCVMLSGRQATSMPSPYVDINTIQDATDLAGFEFNTPQLSDGVIYRAIPNDMIEVIDMLDDTKEIRYRKGILSDDIEDISGDYNVYDNVEIISINGIDRTFKGNNNQINCVTWTDNGYAYSITINLDGDGLSKEEVYSMLDVIS